MAARPQTSVEEVAAMPREADFDANPRSQDCGAPNTDNCDNSFVDERGWAWSPLVDSEEYARRCKADGVNQPKPPASDREMVR